MARNRKVGRDRKILEAAAKLFYERGFDAVGVDEIGEQAGVTGPAIYRHFASKDEILATLFDEALDGLFAVTGGTFDDPFEEVRHRTTTHVRYVLQQRRLASVLFREDRSLAGPFRRRLHRREREYIDSWIDCLQRCFPDRDANELIASVHAVIGMLTSVAHWPEDALRANEIPELLTGLVLGGLSAGRAEPSQALASSDGPEAQRSSKASVG